MPFRLLLIFLVLSGAGAMYLPDERASSLCINLVAAVIGGMVMWLYDNRGYWMICAKTLRIAHVRVRVSISYLIRIQVGERFLLVRGNRLPNKFQPVGGVFKLLPDRENVLRNRFQAEPDTLIKYDADSERDLRFYVKGRYLIPVINWFASKADREVSPWREFHEELVAPGHLPADAFGYIFYRYLRMESKLVLHSPFVGGPELLIAEVYELTPTPKQQKCLEKLDEKRNPSIRWVTATQIAHMGVQHGQALDAWISEHTSWLLSS